MQTSDERNQEKKILELVREIVEFDQALRSQYHIGDKFRFVRDQLNALLAELEEAVKQQDVTLEETDLETHSDEILVYVYLYNANGISLQAWEAMISPKVFYEYSVNRPIYAEKHDIEILLRSKANKLQHAYLTITIKKSDVVQGGMLKDRIDNPILKIKEGALHFKKLIGFTHNGQEYILTSEGRLIKKR